MKTSKENIIDNAIKAKLSKLLPDSNFGVFIRQTIFSITVWNWVIVAKRMQNYFPEEKENIQRILDFNLSNNEIKRFDYE